MEVIDTGSEAGEVDTNVPRLLKMAKDREGGVGYSVHRY